MALKRSPELSHRESLMWLCKTQVLVTNFFIQTFDMIGHEFIYYQILWKSLENETW